MTQAGQRDRSSARAVAEDRSPRDDEEVLNVASEARRNRLQVLVHGGVETQLVLRARADDRLLHVQVGRV